MIIVKGHVFYTIVDFARDLGVSAKTIRDYLRKGIIPKPPEIRYGVRTIKHFPVEYMRTAKASLDAYRKSRDRNNKKMRVAGKEAS